MRTGEGTAHAQYRTPGSQTRLGSQLARSQTSQPACADLRFCLESWGAVLTRFSLVFAAEAARGRCGIALSLQGLPARHPLYLKTPKNSLVREGRQMEGSHSGQGGDLARAAHEAQPSCLGLRRGVCRTRRNTSLRQKLLPLQPSSV